MGLNGCYSVLKYLLVFLSIIFAILGIAGVSFAIWVLVDPTFALSLTQEYVVSVIIILVASLLLIVVAVFGLIGALQENQCALTTFFCLLLIIFVAEISAGVWMHVNQDNLKEQVKKALEVAVEKEYYNGGRRKAMIDTFQKELQCCGANGPSDWIGTKQVVVSVTAPQDNYSIPSTCCIDTASDDICKRKTHNIKPTNSLDFAVIHSSGCYGAMMQKLKEHSSCFLIAGIVLAVVQVSGLIFALILAFAVNRSRRYKA